MQKRKYKATRIILLRYLEKHSEIKKKINKYTYSLYRGVDKSLARQGRTQAASVINVMSRGRD